MLSLMERMLLSIVFPRSLRLKKSGVFQAEEKSGDYHQGSWRRRKGHQSKINFRVAQSNHRRGDYDSQQKFILIIHMLMGEQFRGIFIYFNNSERRYVFSCNQPQGLLRTHSNWNDFDWRNKWSRSRSN